METSYFSFQGRKLKMYKLKDDFYAIDSDIAAFYNVSKKYLLFISNINKEEFEAYKIELFGKEFKEIFEAEKEKQKVFAFNLGGIIFFSHRIRKSDVAHKVAIASVKETGKCIDQIVRINKVLDNYVKMLKYYNDSLFLLRQSKHLFSDKQEEYDLLENEMVKAKSALQVEANNNRDLFEYALKTKKEAEKNEIMKLLFVMSNNNN